MLTVAIGSDDAGYTLKEELKKHLETLGINCTDFGVAEDELTEYPVIAKAVALAVSDQKYDRGILICGTGIGMSIVANKIGNIRAALCHDTYSAERARKSNDAQIITMGARVIGAELAKKIVEVWLANDFAGGGSTTKLEKIKEIDKEFRKKPAKL